LREERGFNDAIVQHSAAVQLQPQSAAAHNSLGLSLAKAGRDADAIHHYGRALALQPGFIDAYLNLAEVSRDMPVCAHRDDRSRLLARLRAGQPAHVRIDVPVLGAEACGAIMTLRPVCDCRILPARPPRQGRAPKEKD